MEAWPKVKGRVQRWVVEDGPGPLTTGANQAFTYFLKERFWPTPCPMSMSPQSGQGAVVVEDLGPPFERSVGGDDGRTALVALAQSRFF